MASPKELEGDDVPRTSQRLVSTCHYSGRHYLRCALTLPQLVPPPSGKNRKELFQELILRAAPTSR